MKNLVCPYSPDKISENVPRIVALFVIILLVLYIITGWAILPAFLVIDFLLRGFFDSSKSVLSRTAKIVNSKLLQSGKLIDKAPKVFAARLGFVFIISILMAQLLGFSVLAVVLSSGLVLFAGLECIVNFCLGCWVYSFLVLPFYTKANA